MSEQLLNGSEVGAPLEQVRRERVPEQVGVHALRLEPGRAGKAAQDEERAGAGERASLRVQEELGPAPAVEEGAAAREVAPERLDGGAPDRDDPLPAALARDADEPVVEVDRPPGEPDRLGD